MPALHSNVDGKHFENRASSSGYIKNYTNEYMKDHIFEL